jgi:hypothetical protein
MSSKIGNFARKIELFSEKSGQIPHVPMWILPDGRIILYEDGTGVVLDPASTMEILYLPTVHGYAIHGEGSEPMRFWTQKQARVQWPPLEVPGYELLGPFNEWVEEIRDRVVQARREPDSAGGGIILPDGAQDSISHQTEDLETYSATVATGEENDNVVSLELRLPDDGCQKGVNASIWEFFADYHKIYGDTDGYLSPRIVFGFIPDGHYEDHENENGDAPSYGSRAIITGKGGTKAFHVGFSIQKNWYSGG